MSYYFSQPPMMSPPAIPQQFDVLRQTSRNTFPFTTVTILVVVMIILLMFSMVSSCLIMDCEVEKEHHTPRKVLTIPPPQGTEKEYKVFKAPRNGTVKLSKGSVDVVHHDIKEDSIILLSRKTISGKGGNFLSISTIKPNKNFRIISTDEVGNIEEEDNGEIYFLIF